jgi:hypothetical protein
VRQAAGPGGLERLRPDSLRYALLMRKYQIEAFRREVPAGGYVISVIRDIPNATMGLLDYDNQPKWSLADWEWHRETICLLKTPADCRSFTSGEPFQAELWLSHFGAGELAGAELTVELVKPDTPDKPCRHWHQPDLRQAPGTLRKLLNLNGPLPEVTRPTRYEARAVLWAAGKPFRNHWPLWVLPNSAPTSRSRVMLHASVPAAVRDELFPHAPPLPLTANPGAVVVATRFDDALAQTLKAGGHVLLLPDGGNHSFPLTAHWFLRGAPYISGHPLLQVIPRDMLVELQHFDLAGDVIPNLEDLAAIDPVLMLWDTHDLKTVKMHGLIFETRVGQGRLLVSAVKHTGTTNAAGRWLLDVLLQHLQSGPAPNHALPGDLWSILKK